MTRLGRDLSWHLVALALVVAGLGVLAPLAWWKTRPEALTVADPTPHNHEWTPAELLPPPVANQFQEAVEPQVAPLRPLVADEIRLDPSVTETPALPTSRPPTVDQQLFGEPSGDLRLSAARPSVPLPPLENSRDLTALKEPLDSPATAAENQHAEQPANLPPTKAWPYPAALFAQLQALADSTPPAAGWAAQARADLDRLIQLESLTDPAVIDVLSDLRKLADEAKTLAQSAADDQARSRIQRAGYAIVRRIVVWDQVHTLAVDGPPPAAPIIDRRDWLESLDEVDSLLGATGAAVNWRKYLLIDQARSEFDSSACSPGDQRQLARDILHRLHSTQLSHDQEKFLKSPPFAALADQLKARAAEAPNYVALVASIEEHERVDDRSAFSRGLAAHYDLLRWSPEKSVRDLADTINCYYRNANVRVALSAELANRFLPRERSQLEAVEDTILGAWVSGQSQTSTNVKLVLIPDQHRWNIGLEANGQVATDTSSSKGPATFYQNGWSIFRARKRLTVDRRGIRMFNAEAEANANNNLNDFETDFDGIPFLGGFIRRIARNQYETSQPAAKVEVEGKIIYRATSQLDREVAEKLEKAKQDFQVKMVKPLQKLNLEPTAVDLETTTERLIARYRVAAREQVSAHTPRPQAPGDSVLSVQVHESALNNVLEKLHLAGRHVALEELYKEMTTRFNPGKTVEIPEDLPVNVFVTFAEEDPVRVDCQDGRVRLTIRIKELAQGSKNRWTNFMVRGYYGPSADQLDANLEREGIIELIPDPDPIRLGEQVVLRGIFAKVLSRNRKLHIINKQIAGSPELKHDQVTQFVIHDGWIGVALGPAAPGREARMYPRPPLDREGEP